MQEIKTREEQEFLRERNEDEMEMSDGEDSTSGEPSAKKKRVDGRILLFSCLIFPASIVCAFKTNRWRTE